MLKKRVQIWRGVGHGNLDLLENKQFTDFRGGRDVRGRGTWQPMRQASVDNHAVVVEPGRLPEGRAALTLLRSGPGKTKMIAVA